MILAQDEHDGPRFPTTRKTLASFFKEHNLVFIVCDCNASGLSKHHCTERRMAPLSVALAGIVLLHDQFASNLDDPGKTRDADLGRKKFQKAAAVLCDLWNNINIDNSSVKCSY